MDLILGQLVYTSFAEMGLRILTSTQIPQEVQQALIQRIASKHWNSYSPPRTGYRAVYLHQVTSEQTLFGWFYNDEADDVGRTHVPYFICYYLAEPLLKSQLENIFTCLHKGPLALVDRQNPPASLEDLVISDLNYQPVRPGVEIPPDIRRYSYIALKQEQSLDLFIPVDEQEMVNKRNEQPNEQKADFSIGTHYPVEGAETGTADLNEDAAIEAEMAQSRQRYQEKLQEYEYVLVEAIQREYPISDSIRNLLKSLQQVWKLRDEDTKLIESRIVQQRKAVKPSEKIIETIKSKGVTHRNIQLLLGIGITATFLALISSIYGLLQSSIFAPNNSIVISSPSSSIYKTFTEVPNVPQGLFNYGGSTTFAPLRFAALVSAINQAQPQFQLRYAGPVRIRPGSGTGIEMLLAGELSFAQSSRPLKDSELAQAKKRGFTLEQVPIAIDGIAFYVNPQVSVPGLSLPQLRDVFTGKITNWKAVGGSNQPITLFSRDLQASGTVDFVKENVLAGEELGSSVIQVKSTTESIRKVAETRGGIGYATASEVIGQSTVYPLPLSRGADQTFVSPFTVTNRAEVNKAVFANGSYPLTRRLFVIIKRDGRLDEQAGSAYVNLLLTDEGQRLVEQAGFVPIH